MTRGPAAGDRGGVTPVLIVVTAVVALAALAAAGYGGWFILTH
ncbi:hypothetical protein [Pseudolysinimonas sp.]